MTCRVLHLDVICRSLKPGSLQDMPTDLATYVSQMKYYERMHKVKEREQHIQEVTEHGLSV